MTDLSQDATPLTEALVREALARASSQQRAIDWLAQSLALPVEQFGPLAAEHFGLEWLAIDQMHACTPDFELVTFVEATRRQCMALKRDGRTVVVLSDPLDTRTQAWATHRLRERHRCDVTWAFAASGDLQAYLTVAERSLRALDAVSLTPLETNARASTALSVSISAINAAQSQIVRLVDSTIHDALKSDASDIHFETHAHGLSIKYRLDGVLVLIRSVEGLDTAHQALSRIKVVAELDIAERRVPQDGRIKVAIDGTEIDLRVSVMPNLFGEDAVLRILDRRHLTRVGHSLRLDNLGFDDETLAFIRQIAGAPHGLLLATGPTGSGKTTTLYAALTEVNTGLDKIITIEDPVEYQVQGVLQIPVNERKGLTFARGLRSILRHDPDKIMVGEIRDPETAQIAVQAALTGHQVFTSVHANNVFDVIGRFNVMGVDTYSFVSALSGVVAQRLVRLNCRHCMKCYEPAHESLSRSALHTAQIASANFARGAGCAQCRGTGFKGRKAIAERLPMTDALRDLLSERAPLARIKSEARSGGYSSLREAAVAAVLAGETTLEEINRVTTLD